MKKVVAGAITSLVLVGLLVGAGVWPRGLTADEPAACLTTMYDAMKAGHVANYLDCFGGELRERLERDAQDQATGKFAVYLKELAAPITGRAVMHDTSEQAGPDRARLVVERVYDGRQWERQAYRLRRDAGRWKIFEIEHAELFDPPVPYGAPAFPVPDDSAETAKPSSSER